VISQKASSISSVYIDEVSERELRPTSAPLCNNRIKAFSLLAFVLSVLRYLRHRRRANISSADTSIDNSLNTSLNS